MGPDRLPGLLLSVTALGFLVWAVLLVSRPGGPAVLEWTILLVAGALAAYGIFSFRDPSSERARVIRWVLLAFAVFGAVAVIGLTADDSSSRTWVRLAWAALVSGLVTSVVAWWSAPRVDRRTVVVGGVFGLVIVASGVGITANCDPTIQRSWCEPAFEQEEALAARISVEGVPDRDGRAGGDTGAYVRAFLIDGVDIDAVTTVPTPFVFEERPIQSIEEARGRYTADSGADQNCQIDAKVETIPAGNLLTLNVSCSSQV